MKNKYISSQSSHLLSHFNDLGQQCFSLAEAYSIFPNSGPSSVRELLSDMNRRGLILRLREALYYIIPFDKEADTFIPDWHIVTKYLVKNAKHYIGYYSALQIHNLITQPSLKQQVVVSKQQFPSKLNIKSVTFQFIYHNEKHFFGAKKIWVDNFNKVSCSDLEKTIIDCLYKPHYAGGIVEIAKAIFTSRNKINYNRLLNYAIQFKSQSVLKRLGYLLELLGIQTEIVRSLHSLRSSSYTVLDTELPRKGKRLSRWKVQKNIDEETIKSALYT